VATILMTIIIPPIKPVVITLKHQTPHVMTQIIIVIIIHLFIIIP
jgi:hypothetical protein